MNKYHTVKSLKNNGDSIITLKNGDGLCVTTDFSAKYIRRKKAKRLKFLKDCILLFSWTDDMFKNVKIYDIKSILPLAALLKNTSPEIIIDA